MSELSKKIEGAINECSAENGSNTPDFLLAEYLTACLAAYEEITKARDKWYSVHLEPCGKSHFIKEEEKCTHMYSKSMDQDYPRKCLRCGEEEVV